MVYTIRKKIFFILTGVLLSLVFLEIILRISGFGYNVFHPVPAAASGEYRIFCIGESTTWGMGAKDPSTQSYPRQLENMLNEEFKDIDIKVFHDQAVGKNTSEISDKLPLWLKKYQPNLAIIMCGANNWWNLNRSNILLFNKNKTINILGCRMLIFLDKFRTWKLFKWVSLSLGRYKTRWNYPFSEDKSGEKLSSLYGGHIWKIVEETVVESDIKEMVEVCRINGVKIIISNYPRSGGKEQDAVHKKIATQFNIPFVDNLSTFDNLANLDKYLWKDKWHPNELGYEIVAENIYRCIIDNNLVE